MGVAKKYLLGMLSDDESAQFEQRYSVDDELFEAIEVEEDELVDAYVRKVLSSSDRKRFEKSLVDSKRLRERVAFGQVLLAKASTQSQKVSWWNRFINRFAFPAAVKTALASGVVIVVLGGVSFQWMRLREQSKQLAAERSVLEQQKRRLEQQIAEVQSNAQQIKLELENRKADLEKLNQELESTKQKLAQAQQAPGAPIFATLTLFASSARSVNDGEQLVISSPNTIAKLNLILDADEHSTYRVSIGSADGRTPILRQGLKASGPASERTVSLQFPASKLQPADYAVNVSGRTPSGSYEPLADYRFRLVKK